MVSCVFKGPISVGMCFTDVSLTLLRVHRGLMNSQEISQFSLFTFLENVKRQKNTSKNLPFVISDGIFSFLITPSHYHFILMPFQHGSEKIHCLQLASYRGLCMINSSSYSREVWGKKLKS